MLKKIPIYCLSVGLLVPVFAQANTYDLTINNQAVVFTLINKTCNGGRIDSPPKQLPIGSIQFTVQSDAQQGCMLRYDDGRGSLLGIWIHQQQVDCSHQATLFSYYCIFRQNTLIISN